MQSIVEILTREPQGILSLTGGGGKTSLMFHLAQLLVRSGKRVLTTTTTKIFVPTSDQSETLLVDPDPEEILRQIGSFPNIPRHVTAAATLRDGDKLKGFEPEAIGVFRKSGLFDWILVEADGSSRRPLKAPAAHEPVVPADTTVHLAVAGLEVLGRRINDELVHRLELAAPLMGLAAGEVITKMALARLFAHPQGAFKGSPPGARRFLFLNKADDARLIEGGINIAEELRRISPLAAEAVIVGQAAEEIRVHAVIFLAEPA